MEETTTCISFFKKLVAHSSLPSRNKVNFSKKKETVITESASMMALGAVWSSYMMAINHPRGALHCLITTPCESIKLFIQQISGVHYNLELKG